MIKKFLLLLTFILIYPINVFSEDIFLSLKKNKVNVRYGPGFNFQVKYVYNKINLPIKQIDQKENFRRIIDLKNNSGWIHVSQLKKSNSIISLDDKILFTKPTVFSKPLAKIKKGRLLVIKKCSNNWCKITTNEFNGWIEAKNIWGSIN
jgi:SH3-like domain-containing protein